MMYFLYRLKTKAPTSHSLHAAFNRTHKTHSLTKSLPHNFFITQSLTPIASIAKNGAANTNHGAAFF